MRKFDVAVIGGGASGMACAVSLAQSRLKPKVVLIEKEDRLGKKLSATGNGQGNISNSDMSHGHYFGGNVQLVERIACRDPYAGAELFDFLFTADEKGRIYPAGRQASALTDCLIRKLNKGGVEIINASVKELRRGFKLSLNDGTQLTADFAVMCAGGKAQRHFGTDGTAYSLVSDFGHKITPLFPSLVQLKTPVEYIKTLKGIRVDCLVSAIYNDKILKTVRGDVIFTEYGVSGNAIFSISPYAADKHDIELKLEFLPDLSANTISENIDKRAAAGVARAELLSGTLHNQLGRAIIKRADKEGISVADMVKNFHLRVLGTLGFDYAQVTRGGIEMDGITEELESKYEKNLFFAGEILDVDGDCGGYNLQWAFTSGRAVAETILKRL